MRSLMCMLMLLLAGACAGQQVRSPLAEAEVAYGLAEASKADAEAKAAEAKAAETAAKVAAAVKGKAFASALTDDAQAKVTAAKAAITKACSLDQSLSVCTATAENFIEARVTGFSVENVTRMGAASPTGWALYVQAGQWVSLLVSGETRAKLVKTAGFRSGVYRFYQDRVERVGN